MGQCRDHVENSLPAAGVKKEALLPGYLGVLRRRGCGAKRKSPLYLEKVNQSTMMALGHCAVGEEENILCLVLSLGHPFPQGAQDSAACSYRK